MIDWDVAISTGAGAGGAASQPGGCPHGGGGTAWLTAVVQQPVRELTGLTSQGDIGPVAVVDRPGWIKANVGGFRVVLEPLPNAFAGGGQLRARRRDRSSAQSGRASPVCRPG